LVVASISQRLFLPAARMGPASQAVRMDLTAQPDSTVALVLAGWGRRVPSAAAAEMAALGRRAHLEPMVAAMAAAAVAAVAAMAAAAVVQTVAPAALADRAFSSSSGDRREAMKYALYNVESKAVIQWQDTDIYNYNEPIAGQARLDLDEESLPSAFDPYTWPTGWWVVDEELTQTAPPPPLSQIAQTLNWTVSGRRFNGIAAGVVLADSTVFAPADTDLTLRIMPIALGHATLGITGIDIQLGGAWHHFGAVDLQDAYAELMVRREEFYSAERVHLEAIAALLADADRPGLEGYDTTTGWPA
jgi:hypothetical protein